MKRCNIISGTTTSSTNTILPSCLMLNLPFFLKMVTLFTETGRKKFFKIQNHLVGYNKSLLTGDIHSNKPVKSIPIDMAITEIVVIGTSHAYRVYTGLEITGRKL